MLCCCEKYDFRMNPVGERKGLSCQSHHGLWGRGKGRGGITGVDDCGGTFCKYVPPPTRLCLSSFSSSLTPTFFVRKSRFLSTHAHIYIHSYTSVLHEDRVAPTPIPPTPFCECISTYLLHHVGHRTILFFDCARLHVAQNESLCKDSFFYYFIYIIDSSFPWFIHCHSVCAI